MKHFKNKNTNELRGFESAEQLKNYVDDAGEWVELTTQSELQAAIESNMSVEDVKSQKLTEIEAGYLSAAYAPIEYSGGMFDADQSSRAVMNDILTGADSTFTDDWVLADNTTMTVTYADLKAISAALIERGKPLFSQRYAYKQQLRTATTVDGINAIQVTYV